MHVLAWRSSADDMVFLVLHLNIAIISSDLHTLLLISLILLDSLPFTASPFPHVPIPIRIHVHLVSWCPAEIIPPPVPLLRLDLRPELR